ncbi:unnamed protein product [Blepharisma stoltei]|uniref:RING-type domain-containing protein n=1 Tax=Blepharisma stoltei TaxID=1481888 RepID=A0AAU9KMN0_9CILI|nr:unnamed protein product [Blepharisma stoltei]
MSVDNKKPSKAIYRKQINDFPACQICAYPYDTYSRLPKLLDCGHTICLMCAESLIKGRSIQCPFDKTSTNLGYLSKLRVNYALLDIVEEGSLISMCEIHNQEVIAYCQNDSALLCVDCVFKHLSHDFYSLNDNRSRLKAEKSKKKLFEFHDKIINIRDKYQNSLNNLGPYLLHIEKVVDEHIQAFKAAETSLINEIKEGTEKCITAIKSLKEVQEIKKIGENLNTTVNRCNKELKKVNEDIQKFDSASTAEQISWELEENFFQEIPTVKNFNIIACSVKINYEEAIRRKEIDKSDFVWLKKAENLDSNNNLENLAFMVSSVSLIIPDLSKYPNNSHKQILGEHLYPLVLALAPSDTAAKITTMILDLPNNDILRMLKNHIDLKAEVEKFANALKSACP